jgi:integrase
LQAGGRAAIERTEDGQGVERLRPITLHECRHRFASPMIAANVNAQALSTYMHHAKISTTLDARLAQLAS